MKKPTTTTPIPTNRIVTLDEFIIRSEKDFDYATGELTGLLRDIGVAAKIVNREVNKAGLVNITGAADGAANQAATNAAEHAANTTSATATAQQIANCSKHVISP